MQRNLLYKSILRSSIYLLVGSFCLVVLYQPLTSQELIPNGDFEIFMGNCEAPDRAFSNVESWYSLNATPDYFNERCDWDPNAAVFWANQDTAARGDGFVGLSCRYNANETYTTEGIATKLTRRLEPMRLYKLELTFRSQGFYQGFPDSLISCPLRPFKRIVIHMSPDSIELQDAVSTGQPVLSGFESISLESDGITEHDEGPWTRITSCIMARGDEEYIAISLPFGNFGSLPPCTMEDNDATFYTFYFDIDDVSLTPFDPIIDSDITICEGGDVDLFSLGIPEMDGLSILWDDGYEGLIRSEVEDGMYDIDILYPCTTIEHSFTIATENCQQSLYIPNVFAPSANSINSIWKVSLSDALSPSFIEIQIFDRWGSQVYMSRDSSIGWDGTRNGEPVGPGAYVYRIEMSVDGEVEIMTGALSLLR